MGATSRPTLGALILVVVLLAGGGIASGSSWHAGLSAGSSGETAAQGAPGTPSATATCSGLILGNIVVTWSATTPADTTYTVYKSTTSATSGFSVVATGVSGTTYTQSGLGIGNYWFKVQGDVGTNWQSALSTATAERTITLVLCS